MKIDPYYQRQKCRSLSLVSGDITFMRIFAGVLWRGGVKRQWGNRKRRFSWLLDATSSAPLEMRPILLCSIIQSPVAFPVTPKYVTLNDLDGLFGVKFCFCTFLAGLDCATGMCTRPWSRDHNTAPLSFDAPTPANPCDNRTNFMSPETRVNGLHFCY